MPKARKKQVRKTVSVARRPTVSSGSVRIRPVAPVPSAPAPKPSHHVLSEHELNLLYLVGGALLVLILADALAVF